MAFIVEYWVQFLFGLVIAFVGYIGRILYREKKIWGACNNGVKLLLKEHIMELYQGYKQADSISVYQKERLAKFYKQYQLLGDSSVVDAVVKEMLESTDVKGDVV